MNKLLSANDTTAATSIANPADTQVEPTTGVILLGKGKLLTANGLKFLPFGTDTATETFLMSVFAWDYINPKAAQNSGRWTAWPLATFLCTLCTLAGSAGGEVDNTNLYCDTITEVIGNANVSNEIISPTGNMKASVILDVKGANLVQVLFARNSSSVSANTLWGKV